MVSIEKLGGEYLVKLPFDHFSLNVLLSLTKSDDFKSFLLVDYESANASWFDFFNVEYKKIDTHTYILPANHIKLIAKDTVKKAIILLCSESYQSLSSKLNTKIQGIIKDIRGTVSKSGELRVSVTQNLPIELSILVTDSEVFFSFRDKKFIYTILSFFVYREMSLLPNEFEVEKLSLILSSINIDRNAYLEFTQFGKCFLPNKVKLSIKVWGDGKVEYFTLSYSRGRWSMNPNNSNRGALNFVHKFLLFFFDRATEIYNKYIYSRFYSFLDKIGNFFSNLFKVYWVKELIIVAFFIVVIYLMLKSKWVSLLVLLYLVWFLYEKFVIFLLFKR